jgi:dipeptidase D
VSAFDGLDPAAFWRHFDALTRIPRPTFAEEQAVEHVTAWARERGFAARADAAGNVVFDVPATPGRESAPTVILQGHLDMVCERDPDSPYDPREGRIGVVRDGDWLYADGTTLGADNGVAIAAMMALAEDSGAPHGPLELLMTVTEEVGMAGAADLDPALITGSVLLNLDSEEDATLTVGCAGGADNVVRLRAPREPVGDGDAVLDVTVAGGRGGHSGGDIASGRANAIKVLGRALGGAGGVRIAALAGGASRNAIPRDATATVVVRERDAAAARGGIAAAGVVAAREFAVADPGVRVTVTAADGAPGSSPARAATARPADAWSAEASARMLDLIAALPVGLLGMSPDFPGAIETSSSIGVAATEGDRLVLRCLSRSSNSAALGGVTGAIAAAARLAGAELERGHEYPAWQPDLGSPVLATARAVHTRLFGAEPQVQLTHGGLEAAVIAAKRPGIDPISFGPLIEGPHAPGERVSIGSSARFMRMLAGLLDELSRRQLQG